MSVKNIGVIGAGMMGSEIALVFAMAVSVVIMEPEQARLDKGMAGIRRFWNPVLPKFWAEEDMATALSIFSADRRFRVWRRDLVIEVFEDEEVKPPSTRPGCGLQGWCDHRIEHLSISITVLASYLSENASPVFLACISSLQCV